MQGNNSDGRPSQGYTSSPETEETKVKLTDAKNRPNKRHGRTLMPRQRARHACLECRARKVRCDVALTGAPCTNCKLDASSCAVQRRRNKRNPLALAPATPFEAESFPNLVQLEKNAALVPELDHSATDFDMDVFNNYVDMDRLFSTAFDSTGLLEPTVEAMPEFVNPLALSKSILPESTPPVNTAASLLPQDRPETRRKSGMVLFIFHEFIEVGVPGLAWSHNASILEEKGCFHVPEKPAMDDFVRQFFLYVQPFMPLIDEGHFWNVYSAQRAGNSKDLKKYSLFVVQALLFMACPFVSAATLSSLGFSSVRKARAAFYSRAKALFDNDCCCDDVSKAQGALMLTYHYNHPGELLSKYWLDTAVHFARRAGADILTDASRTGQARKRLWWCCILRDNIMSLGLRRHLSIRAPKHVDYQEFALTEDDLENEVWNSQVCKPDEKQVLVRLFTSLCKLGIVLRDVLELVYPPEDGSYQRETVENCQGAKAMLARLDLWFQVAHVKVQAHAFSYEDGQASIKLLSNSIYMYYHSARTALLNHMILVSTQTCVFKDDDTHVAERWVQKELNKSFRCLTRSLTELEQRSLAQYLPNTFIAISAFSFVWFTLGAEMTGQKAGSDEMLAGLKTNVVLMTTFSNLYENTDHFLRCIEKLVSSARSAKITDNLFPSTEARTTERAGDIDFRIPHSPASGKLASQDLLQDVVVGNQRCYLWLTLSIDYSLCHGNLPDIVDFPKCIQGDAKAILAG